LLAVSSSSSISSFCEFPFRFRKIKKSRKRVARQRGQQKIDATRAEKFRKG